MPKIRWRSTMTRREMLVRSVAGMSLTLGRRSLTALASPGMAEDVKGCWPVRSDHPFHRALREGACFSFSYDGKRVGRAFSSEWQSSTQNVAGVTTTVFRHFSGLLVVREARSYPEFEAVEYSLRFKNESQSALPPLGPVNAMDIEFGGEVLPGLSVVSSGGGEADSLFPPKDFAVTRTSFSPLAQFGALMPKLTLSTSRGNSSTINLPFFFVENEDASSGIFVGIGWTGDWQATIQPNYERSRLLLQGGMPDLSVELQPGEEISSPSILLGAYSGSLADGGNRLRKLIRDQYAPSVGGQRLQPPMLYTTWFDVDCELDDKLFRILVDNAAAIGQEIIMMDAGWYKGVTARPYSDMQGTWNAISNPLGNWEEGEEKSRFPSGLRALANYVRSKGMQFGLWFEPERVGPQSVLAQKHPDWIVWIKEELDDGRPWGMVYFGNPDVPAFVCKILDHYIRELGLRYIRWDQNNNLLPYWKAHDTPGRRGISQIRHLEGVHRVEDWVREHHPDVILESCAGGGQRIDLSTLRRRHTIWISDQTMDPDIVRFHLEGLNQFIPGNCQMVGFAPPTTTYEKPGFVFEDVSFQSYFAGAFGSAGRLHEWPESMKAQMRKHVAAYKKIRQYLAEDFYLLLPQPRDLSGWEAWQFHNPKTEEGFVQVFRIRASQGSKRIILRALDPWATYRFTDVYTAESVEVAGTKAVSEGVRFELSPRSSKVVVYQRVS